MKSKELAKLSVPRGEARRQAHNGIQKAVSMGIAREALPNMIRAVVKSPQDFLENEYFANLANMLAEQQEEAQAAIAETGQTPYVARDEPAPYRIWGEDLDQNSVQQMDNACSLPISVRGALMADAHLGYGLPIGGVLAVRNAVIPYAVGVDIACRVKMTVLDMPTNIILGQRDRLVNALEQETRFGIGAKFHNKREHDVMDEDWSITPLTARLKDKAWSQLGTSGSGNHFVEFGTLEVTDEDMGVEPGTYLALLSHSGSRGSGAQIADHYSKLAMSLHPELPKQLKHLAWLDFDTELGQEYWMAMELMGQYASANHACIHRHILKALGAKSLLQIENHHNFAWIEEHDGETYAVHRKGATPAHEGVLGIIPGSMASSTYVVRGKGNKDSLGSAAHGAGRRMSRKAAKSSFTWSAVKKHLAEREVDLISAGLDEVPMAYKDIEEVMAAQDDLVQILARFSPRLVKMAPAGERPED